MKIAHNETEFNRIYQKFFDNLYKFIFIKTKNEQDTADIIQDAFYKLFTTEKDFNDDEHIKAWLFTCSKNLCIDFFRKKDNSHTDLDSVAEQGENMKSDETLPVLLELDDKYKDALVLHYYEGYKTDEIANILGVAHSTVRIRLKRGRELLKNKLKGAF